MEEASLREPATATNKFPMEQGNLAGGPTEAHQTQLPPEAGGVPKGHGAF